MLREPKSEASAIRENSHPQAYEKAEYREQQISNLQPSSLPVATGMMNMLILSSNTSENRKVKAEKTSEYSVTYNYGREYGLEAAPLPPNKHTNNPSATLYEASNINSNIKIDSGGYYGTGNSGGGATGARRNSSSVAENHGTATAHHNQTTKYKSHSKQKWICDHCGKVYKHPNCLSKHKWEHTDAWKETNKLSISKHQQVQLLEAASVLIGLSNPNAKEFIPKSENKISATLSDDGFKHLQISSNTTSTIPPAILSSQSLPSMSTMSNMSLIMDYRGSDVNMEGAPSTGYSDDEDLESIDSNPRVFGMEL